MPLFAIPLASSSTTTHSHPTNTRPHFTSLPIRKRKRRRASSNSPSDSLSDNDVLPASTNPLSLTPDEIVQYRIAGLELDEEVPEVKDFPHRGLGELYLGKRERRKGKSKGRERAVQGAEEVNSEEVKKEDVAEEIKVKRAERGPPLRLQHLSVLTTILQRCLLEGDIQRASRAWAMLIRAQVGGRGMDLRGSGYWGIGAELLIRSLDRKRNYSYDSDYESDDEEEEVGGVKRWGSAEGLEKAKDYYERLILQHPYKRQFDGSVSALDFWPAMIGCEIYGLQFEQRQGLRGVAREEEEDEGGERSGSQSEESEEELEEGGVGVYGAFAAEQRRKLRRMRRRAERRWIERDEIRITALIASEKIAARLDELMTTPPYSDSHNLLRLRGMLTLYVGDLRVPAMPPDEANEDKGVLQRRRQLSSTDEDTERRFLYRQRVTDHERGKEKRKEEQERARKLFDRITREGGPIEDIKDLSSDQDEGPEEFYDAEE